MLKSWSIENFKPIVNSGELKLAPVTVLAGRNSSGKSSLLQSILMIAQTLSNRVVDRPLLPNGPIVQLGTFEDILNKSSLVKTLTVSFKLDIYQNLNLPDSEPSELFINSVYIKATFNSGKRNDISHSAIEASKVLLKSIVLNIQGEDLISYWYDEENDEEWGQKIQFDFSCRKLTEEESIHFLENVISDYLRLVPLVQEQTYYVGNFEPNINSIGSCLVGLSHFLPTHLVEKLDFEMDYKQKLEEIIDRLFLFGHLGRLSALQILDINAALPEDLKDEILIVCKSLNIRSKFTGQTYNELAAWYRSFKKLSLKKRNAFKEQLKIIIVRHLIQDSLKTNVDQKTKEVLKPIRRRSEVMLLDGAITEVTRFFASKIRYLGPLRADPQASQKFAPSSELDDVGAKGEYAAAVYDANQNAIINWYNPHNKQAEAGTLKEALDSWVRYLGIANQVKIEAAGQSGFSWWVVSEEDDVAFPLSAVGVGVSQILPILVMGLLSPSGTLLMVEQPELHLHPSVQARLGDFFIGLSKCKKQCLIETHSENLVSQLRYHIVEAGGTENSNCMIYFVDQDEKGAASFEQVEISPNGNILNWPDGFFDETMRQEDRITSASLRKRARKVKNG